MGFGFSPRPSCGAGGGSSGGRAKVHGPGVARPSSRGPRLSGHRVLRVGHCARRPGWQRGPGAASGTPEGRQRRAWTKRRRGVRARRPARGAGHPTGLLLAAQARGPAQSPCTAGRARHFLSAARLGWWGCAQDFAFRPAHKARGSWVSWTFLGLPTPL